MAFLSLTAEAKRLVAEVIKPGDLVVDATLGNGHDCLFLASLVGPAGQVLAMDIQEAAIRAGRARLEAAALAERVTFIHDSHANLARYLSADRPLAAALFNLGYLPGSNKNCITRAESTLAGLEVCLEHLRSGGCVSLLAYLGHPGGLEECQAIRQRLELLDGDFWHWEEIEAPAVKAPRLFCCWRRQTGIEVSAT